MKLRVLPSGSHCSLSSKEGASVVRELGTEPTECIPSPWIPLTHSSCFRGIGRLGLNIVSHRRQSAGPDATCSTLDCHAMRSPRGAHWKLKADITCLGICKLCVCGVGAIEFRSTSVMLSALVDVLNLIWTM